MARGRKKKMSEEVQTEVPETAQSTEKKPRAKGAAPKMKSEGKVLQETIVLQSAGVEWNIAELRQKVIDAYIASGHRWGNVKSLELYIKPEERKVYFVINGKVTDSVSID